MTHSEAGRLGAIKTSLLARQRSLIRYYEDPVVCLECESVVVVPAGIQPSTIRVKKFCSQSCAAKYNNKQREKKKNFCLVCAVAIDVGRKYCSAKCLGTVRHKEAVVRARLDTGVKNKCLGSLRKELFRQRGPFCWKCKWGKINPTSGKTPLVMNHIDGDSTNNMDSNLELLCPNCDSLTSTYKGLNRGKGRHSRRQRYKEGKSY
jgi:predicted nucleic acid-binding Zn ribbon protein